MRVVETLAASALTTLCLGAFTVPTIAAPAAPAQTIVTTLGTAGGPAIRVKRSEPASLVRVGDDYYLIDCGIGTIRRLAEAGVPSTKIKALFFTHQHPDHNLGLADFLGNRRFLAGGDSKIPPLKIIGPTGTKAVVDAAEAFVDKAYTVFTDEGVIPVTPDQLYSVQDVLPGNVYTDGAINVDALANAHYSQMADSDPLKLKSFSYRFATSNGLVVFTGDTGPDPKLATFGTNADLLISEVVNIDAMAAMLKNTSNSDSAGLQVLPPDTMLTHMKLEHLPADEVGKLATAMHAGTVVLNHLGPETDSAGVLPDIQGVKKFFAGPVFAANDLDSFCLTKADGKVLVKACKH